MLFRSAWVFKGSRLYGAFSFKDNWATLSADGNMLAWGEPDFRVAISNLNTGMARVWHWSEDEQDWVFHGEPIFGLYNFARIGSETHFLFNNTVLVVASQGISNSVPGRVNFYHYNPDTNRWDYMENAVIEADYGNYGQSFAAITTDEGAVRIASCAPYGNQYDDSMMDYCKTTEISADVFTGVGQNIIQTFNLLPLPFSPEDPDNLPMWSPAADTTWERAIIDAPAFTNTNSKGQFGDRVHTNKAGDYIVVGAYYWNAVYVYKYDAATLSWVQYGNMISRSRIGAEVRISEDGQRIIVQDRPGNPPWGYVYAYDYVDGTWVQKGTGYVGWGVSMDASNDCSKVVVSPPTTVHLAGFEVKVFDEVCMFSSASFRLLFHMHAAF